MLSCASYWTIRQMLDCNRVEETMGDFREIESAAKRLSAEERRRLVLSLAASLREEGRPLPAPRAFTSEEVADWIKGDEGDLPTSGIARLSRTQERR